MITMSLGEIDRRESGDIRQSIHPMISNAKNVGLYRNLSDNASHIDW